jgi:uncharacterized circularly permuted ATP-grasp superfamily protein/uncharacterized alpha-E superfamily protein
LLGSADSLGYGHGAVWDEMVTGTGRLRPHWQFLMGRLAPLDAAELGERRDEAGRLFRQNGVAYTIYGDPKGAERPWPLDLIPLVIPAEEWRAIETGALQRAHLLNAILADIYGPQRLVDEGHLPPSLLHANPNFLRPACGIAPPGGIHLHFYAIDLARSPDGQWWVLADRTQSPSGAGYALENRSVVGRVLADCLADGAVEPVAPFFAALRDNLCALSPRTPIGKRSPRLVVLTPGPYNETYFEHAYLARQLGVTLVEGADLTVRDRRVFLKTLSALEPIDVIFRRLDDNFCDPLELRADSTLGVAGLAEAARAGTVTIANALGSGVLEAAAFNPFLAGLCQAMLGEPLKLPDVASWWCGGAKERAYVLDHLAGLVVKPTFPILGHEPVFGAELSESARKNLAARIADRPMAFVGQERVELSTVPVWDGNRLVPRPMVLRVFVAATRDGFVVMPGGLTRTSPASGPPVVSMQRGGGCKDTWIVGSELAERRVTQTDYPNVVPLRHAEDRRETAGELPSRAADGLFWVGRYAERANGVIRLLRTLLLGITDAARPWTMHEVEPLLTLAVSLDLVPRLEFGNWQAPALGLIPVIQSALTDPAHPNGALVNLQRLVSAAAGVRDRLPPDCWRVITALARQPATPLNRPAPARLLLRLDELVMLSAALWGAVDDIMQRDAGWRFLEIGKWLERAINLIAIIDSAAKAASQAESEGGMIDEDRLLGAIFAVAGLRAPAAGRSDGTLDRAAALSALLTNESDPFSVAFQLGALSAHLRELPPPSGWGPSPSPTSEAAITRALDAAQSARSLLSAALDNNAADMRSGGTGSGTIRSLHQSLAPVASLLPEISNLLTQAYLIHVFARQA